MAVAGRPILRSGGTPLACGFPRPAAPPARDSSRYGRDRGPSSGCKAFGLVQIGLPLARSCRCGGRWRPDCNSRRGSWDLREPPCPNWVNASWYWACWKLRTPSALSSMRGKASTAAYDRQDRRRGNTVQGAEPFGRRRCAPVGWLGSRWRLAIEIPITCGNRSEAEEYRTQPKHARPDSRLKKRQPPRRPAIRPGPCRAGPFRQAKAGGATVGSGIGGRFS